MWADVDHVKGKAKGKAKGNSTVVCVSMRMHAVSLAMVRASPCKPICPPARSMHDTSIQDAYTKVGAGVEFELGGAMALWVGAVVGGADAPRVGPGVVGATEGALLAAVGTSVGAVVGFAEDG
jgi:hypothetical protein